MRCFSRLFALVSVVLTLLLLFSVPVLAQDETPPVDTPDNFLAWLALGGAPLIGALTALLERKAKWFQNLSSDGKWWVSFALGAGIPAVAGLLLLYVPPDFWHAITPAFFAVASAIVGYLGKELTYLFAVRPIRPKQ